MEKASKYVKLITEMYVLSDKVVEKLNNNLDLIEKTLKNYYWDDIKFAIEKYYTYKNDKTYPKLCHITAILNATGKELHEEPTPEIKPPHTNIRSLQKIFPEVCLKLHEDGIFWCEYLKKVKNIPFGSRQYLDLKTRKLINKQWAWDDAIATMQRNFPQEYNKFQNMTTIETYALAYKLGCYKAQE
jgi:hypothetical protein